MITTAAQESKPKDENSYRKVHNVVTDCSASFRRALTMGESWIIDYVDNSIRKHLHGTLFRWRGFADKLSSPSTVSTRNRIREGWGRKAARCKEIFHVLTCTHKEVWFYAGRAAGGDRYHRHLDRAAVASGASSARSGPPEFVPESCKTTGFGTPQPP